MEPSRRLARLQPPALSGHSPLAWLGSPLSGLPPHPQLSAVGPICCVTARCADILLLGIYGVFLYDHHRSRVRRGRPQRLQACVDVFEAETQPEEGGSISISRSSRLSGNRRVLFVWGYDVE